MYKKKTLCYKREIKNDFAINISGSRFPCVNANLSTLIVTTMCINGVSTNALSILRCLPVFKHYVLFVECS